MVLTASVPAKGATPGHFLLNMTFKTQGKITASATGKPGTSSSDGIPCQGFRIAEPNLYDAASGLASGKRMHDPVVLTREVDSSSPKLYHAYATGETFTIAKLVFPKTSGGKVVSVNTLELTDGLILKIEPAPSKNGKRWEKIVLKFTGKKLNGTPTSSSGGAEHYWWRDGW